MKTLSLEAKRQRGTNCEVIAYLMKKPTETPSLHKNFGGHKALLGQLKKAGELSASTGAMCLVRYKGRYGGKHVLFVNLGTDATGIDRLPLTEKLRRLGALVTQKLASEKVSAAVVHYESFLHQQEVETCDALALSQSLAEGLWLASYKFKKYFSKQDKESFPEKVFITSKDNDEFSVIKKGVDAAEAVTDAVFVARDFGNEPSNELTPAIFADQAKALAKKYGLKATVFDEKKIKQEKMNLLYAVGQGSVHPPRLIVLEYKGPKAKTTLALVGKGMTFDSGGISIKPSARMEEMKHDMCGAAAVVGATLAIAKLKLPINILCVVPAADNMPDGNATQPGHVIKSRSGKTVEINNTDAEGRLILADAVDWTQDQKPDFIIDAATLTGAASVALGKLCAGLMGVDDDLSLTICEASAYSGERVWELPLYKEYMDEMRSEYADMRNTGDSPHGGVMRGGIFIRQFIREGTKWAHVDIANVANDHSVVPYDPRKGASGYGVRLFVDVAKLLSANQFDEE